MGELIRSLGLFVKQTWALVLVAGALAVQPARIAVRLGLIETEAGLPFPVWAYQAALIVILFGGMFVWFHKRRTEFDATRAPNATQHLWETLRYIAHRSAWARRQPLADGRWVTTLTREFLKALSLGRLTAYGRRCAPAREVAPSAIDPSFWAKVTELSAYEIMSDNTSAHMIYNSAHEAFAEIMFDPIQVTSVWPWRGPVAWALRHSPAEKWAQIPEWKKRDAALTAREREIQKGLSQRFNDNYGRD